MNIAWWHRFSARTGDRSAGLWPRPLHLALVEQDEGGVVEDIWVETGRRRGSRGGRLGQQVVGSVLEDERE